MIIYNHKDNDKNHNSDIHIYIYTHHVCICMIFSQFYHLNPQAFGLGEQLGLRDAVCYGGVPRRGQQQELRRGVELLIATPGRLLDFVNAKVTWQNPRKTIGKW